MGMAEVVEVKEVRREALEMKDKHTVGVKKAVHTDSWIVGIRAREGKLKRIELATELNRKVNDMLMAYCEREGVPYNGAIAGIAREVLRLEVLGYKTEADAIEAGVPEIYRKFIREVRASEELKNSYRNIRMVRV